MLRPIRAPDTRDTWRLPAALHRLHGGVGRKVKAALHKVLPGASIVTTMAA
jgi:hypothetical protein